MELALWGNIEVAGNTATRAAVKTGERVIGACVELNTDQRAPIVHKIRHALRVQVVFGARNRTHAIAVSMGRIVHIVSPRLPAMNAKRVDMITTARSITCAMDGRIE